MSIASNTRAIVRLKINEFGNTVTHTPWSSETYSDEGTATITYGTAASAIMVTAGHVLHSVVQVKQMRENIGELTFIARDDLTIVLKDKITYQSTDYRVDVIRPIRFGDTLVAQRLGCNKI